MFYIGMKVRQSRVLFTGGDSRESLRRSYEQDGFIKEDNERCRKYPFLKWLAFILYGILAFIHGITLVGVFS